MQPSTVLIGHDWFPGELVGWVLNNSRCGSVQLLLGHVKKSDGNRGTWEISDSDACLDPWYVHGLDKWQTMPAEYSFQKVHGAGSLIPRRFVAEVDIVAARSLLNHAASLEGEIIDILCCLASAPEVRMPPAMWGCANC